MVSNFGNWNLFVIWDLKIGIYLLKYSKCLLSPVKALVGDYITSTNALFTRLNQKNPSRKRKAPSKSV